MAIQFPCPGCRNPIEVDDVLGGKAAQCPYCNRVVTVPLESTLSPDAVPVARPGTPPPPPDTSGYPPPPMPPLHVGYTTTLAQKSAATYGNVALVCAILMAVMLAAALYFAIALSFEILPPSAMTQPESIDREDFERQFNERMPTDMGLVVSVVGSVVFALGGLIFSIVSLRFRKESNWRAWLSLPLCGLWVLCQCGGGIFTVLRGG